MNKKKIIINLTEDWFFVSHFLGRAVDATKSGYEVYISCNETNKRKLIEKIKSDIKEDKVYNSQKISLEDFYFFNSQYSLWNKELGLE